MDCYPLRFTPLYKERLWGGEKLRTVLGKDCKGDRIGESWEVSGVPGDVSVVAEGPYAGRDLQDLVDTFGAQLLGQAVLDRFGREFPILIKYIDARQDLSIQLHPDDALARQRHNSFGKTEMWYVMDADPGAELIVGFNRDVTREEYQQALDAGKLTDLLHYQAVEPGDGYFINAGKIHAIGAGILLAEIQQSSDVTYRVYDFDRRDAEGNLRELHTEQALDAMDYQQKDDFRLEYSPKANQPQTLAATPYFTTEFLKLDQPLHRDLASRDAFTIFLCVSGEAEIATADGAACLRRGQTLLIPAAAPWAAIRTHGCELLEVTV
ncbi:mannose-6-phosphate isomerase [Robiginitalea sp. M366]|uniref:type I phosphomannose isomerase catalytic subunit n=1 Tax=Robiginitalea aestuariiviva TaxID=3036903 RepID=UPI00240D27E0|nr:type I phosphomannose isomerase catalytic subunit [Robiginitalea aestuariiviva]MDG1573180.1 mannose-6-phosphate isomerase [Robiginitalea aestuariiviva]